MKMYNITKEMKEKFLNIYQSKQNNLNNAPSFLSTNYKIDELKYLNSYLLEHNLTEEQMLYCISEYNDMFYFKDYTDEYLTASQVMDLTDGFIFDTNLKTILGIATVSNSYHLKFKKIITLEDQIEDKIKETNFLSKIYSKENTFSREKSFKKTNYKILSNKIKPSQLRESALGYLLMCLKGLSQSSSDFSDLDFLEKGFMIINKKDFYSLVKDEIPIPAENLIFKEEITEKDYYSNDRLIVNSKSQLNLYNWIATRNLKKCSENIFLNISIHKILKIDGFDKYYNDKFTRLRLSEDGHLKSIYNHNCLETKDSKNVIKEIKTSNKIYKDLSTSNPETLIKFYYSENTHGINKDFLKELKSELKVVLLENNDYLYKLSIQTLTQAIGQKLLKTVFKNKKSKFKIEKEKVKTIFIEDKKGFTSTYLDQAITLSDIDDLIEFFISNKDEYKKEIDLFINNVEITLNLELKTILKIKKKISNNISEDLMDLLVMKYEDSNNIAYDTFMKNDNKLTQEKLDKHMIDLKSIKQIIEDVEDDNFCFLKFMLLLNNYNYLRF